MSSDVFIKDQLPTSIVKLIEDGIIQPDGTYIGFDALPEVNIIRDGTSSILNKNVNFEPKITYTLTCKHCEYSGKSSEFKCIDKDNLLLQCPNCKRMSLFP